MVLNDKCGGEIPDNELVCVDTAPQPISACYDIRMSICSPANSSIYIYIYMDRWMLWSVEVIRMVSKWFFRLFAKTSVDSANREERLEDLWETGVPPDLAVNETLPVPLSVLTGRLCHTTRWGCCLAPAVSIPFPWAAYWVVSIKKTSVSWMHSVW